MRRAPGGFESRNGRRSSRPGSDYRKRREQAKEGPPAGGADRVSPPSVEGVRRALEAQSCPWCGAGPYKVVAAHVAKAHGVSRSELRVMAGYNSKATICSPESSVRSREALLGRPDRQEMSARGARAAGEAVAAGERAEAIARGWRMKNADKYDEIIRLHEENPDMNLQEIGAAVGMNPRTVKVVLVREGRDPGDLRITNSGRRPASAG